MKEIINLILIFPQACNLLQGLIANKDENNESGPISAKHLERLYIFTIMWSVGALLELDDRYKLELFMRENFDLDIPSTESQQTMFEFYVNDIGVCL